MLKASVCDWCEHTPDGASSSLGLPTQTRLEHEAQETDTVLLCYNPKSWGCLLLQHDLSHPDYFSIYHPCYFLKQ